LYLSGTVFCTLNDKSQFLDTSMCRPFGRCRSPVTTPLHVYVIHWLTSLFTRDSTSCLARTSYRNSVRPPVTSQYHSSPGQIETPGFYRMIA